MHKKLSGFTIVELLIVIVVIAILATISIVAYNGIQLRARDTKRAQDIAMIKKALLMYNVSYGGVQGPVTYGGNGPGGWNLSSGTNWLTFLETEYGSKMPVDPVNTGAADPSTYELTYFYYCYSTATPYVRLGYWSEQTKGVKREDIPVDKCI